MFSTGLACTLPIASVARLVTGSLARTSMTGPDMSVTASADTQFSSSSASAAVGGTLASSSLSSVRSRFRFFGFLSPLNESTFTILIV